MDQEPPKNVSILRIGPFHQDSDCAEALQQAILAHDRRAREHEEEDPHQTSLLQVSNKYFSANVLLHDLQSPSTTPQGTEDGIILVFDDALSAVQPTAMSSSSSSFDAVASLFEQHQPLHTPGDMLRLCVGIGRTHPNSNNKQAEAEFSRRVLWCLDHGFEYVYADISPHAIQTGHDQRDKEGFARVMEAIYGTMWSSAIMNNQTAAKKANLIAVAGAGASQTNHGTSEPSQPESKTRSPNKEQSTTTDRHAKADSTSQEALISDTTPDAMDQAIQEARRIRDVSTSTDLSDQQRRKRAVDAANLVLNMMNQMGMDDEDEQDDISDDNDEAEK